jgi:ribosomal protein S1
MKGKITIVKIDIEKQLVDIGTKPLERKPFEFLRKALIGW